MIWYFFLKIFIQNYFYTELHPFPSLQRTLSHSFGVEWCMGMCQEVIQCTKPFLSFNFISLELGADVPSATAEGDGISRNADPVHHCQGHIPDTVLGAPTSRTAPPPGLIAPGVGPLRKHHFLLSPTPRGWDRRTGLSHIYL